MTEKDLRKLSRLDLLEMLIEQSTELQNVKTKLSQAEEKLNNREIAISEAGSMAEAALRLNGVFTAVEAACQQYLENVQQLCERQEKVCTQREQESLAQAEQLLSDTRKNCEALENTTRIQCAELVSKAKAEAQQYWDDVSAKLDAYYAEHMGLRELLSVALAKRTK